MLAFAGSCSGPKLAAVYASRSNFVVILRVYLFLSRRHLNHLMSFFLLFATSNCNVLMQLPVSPLQLSPYGQLSTIFGDGMVTGYALSGAHGTWALQPRAGHIQEHVCLSHFPSTSEMTRILSCQQKSLGNHLFEPAK